MFKNIVSFSLAIILFTVMQFPSTAASPSPITSWKDWNITFNQEVGSNSNLDAIYVQSPDLKKHPVSVSISADPRKVVVDPTKPYIFGENYTLFIPKEVQSAEGKALQADVTKNFSVESDYIDSIQTNYTSLLTNVIVKPHSSEVTKVEVFIEGTTRNQTLHRGKEQFSKGIFGLARGQTLEVHMYNSDEDLLETLYYKVK